MSKTKFVQGTVRKHHTSKGVQTVLMERESDGSSFAVRLMKGSSLPPIDHHKKYPYVEEMDKDAAITYYQEVSAPVKDATKPATTATTFDESKEAKPLPTELKPIGEVTACWQVVGVAFEIVAQHWSWKDEREEFLAAVDLIMVDMGKTAAKYEKNAKHQRP